MQNWYKAQNSLQSLNLSSSTDHANKSRKKDSMATAAFKSNDRMKIDLSAVVPYKDYSSLVSVNQIQTDSNDRELKIQRQKRLEEM